MRIVRNHLALVELTPRSKCVYTRHPDLCHTTSGVLTSQPPEHATIGMRAKTSSGANWLICHFEIYKLFFGWLVDWLIKPTFWQLHHHLNTNPNFTCTCTYVNKLLENITNVVHVYYLVFKIDTFNNLFMLVYYVRTHVGPGKHECYLKASVHNILLNVQWLFWDYDKGIKRMLFSWGGTHLTHRKCYARKWLYSKVN